MSTLHTLSALPGSEACRDCLRLLADGDALLLWGDGVYAAGQVAIAASVELYLYETDALARGVSTELDGITAVDMAGCVVLTERFVRQMAWY